MYVIMNSNFIRVFKNYSEKGGIFSNGWRFTFAQNVRRWHRGHRWIAGCSSRESLSHSLKIHHLR